MIIIPTCDSGKRLSVHRSNPAPHFLGGFFSFGVEGGGVKEGTVTSRNLAFSCSGSGSVCELGAPLGELHVQW